MELWNEYEGRTIDGLYPLTKLLEPEGRSAFFSTSNGTGVPTVIRLIESHFDDAEILARWEKVAALNHSNLVKLKKFGQVELDGTSLVYAVMEPAEANLGEILRGRRLTVVETKQLAASLTAALETLHSNGLVHEHVEPGNVLAIGEEVKLRSDCVREAPEGEEGRTLKHRDVQDFAVVLLRALTQQRTLEAAARELPLPEPFDQIVKKGISGEWGLREIAALVPPIPVVAPVASPIPPTRPSPSTLSTTGTTVGASMPRVVRPVVRESGGRESGVKEPVAAAGVQRLAGSGSGSGFGAGAKPRERVGFAVEEETRGLGALGLDPRKIAYGVGALLVVLLLWFLMHGRSSGSKSASQKISAPASVEQGNNSVAKDAVAMGSASSAPAAGATGTRADVPANQTPEDTRGQWRVIAYTYNHEDQAKQKVGEIAASHPDLRPEVFTRNGRAPYLVALGGPMSRDEAFAFAGKAKREGLPRDLYAQNYRDYRARQRSRTR